MSSFRRGVLLSFCRVFLAVGAADALWACGGSTGEPHSGPDASAPDASAPDSSRPDTVAPDTAIADASPYGTDGASSDGDASPDFPPDGSDCILEQSSSIPHVRIQLAAESCTYTLAQAQAGISMPYDLIVEEDVADFAPARPYPYVFDSSNLYVAEDLSGNGQHYCLCDQGLPYWRCPGTDGGLAAINAICPAVTIPAGVYHHVFTWDGRNWTGPSDTFNPKGASFPAGEYELAISTAVGSIHDGGSAQVKARRRVRLVP